MIIRFISQLRKLRYREVRLLAYGLITSKREEVFSVGRASQKPPSLLVSPRSSLEGSPVSMVFMGGW